MLAHFGSAPTWRSASSTLIGADAVPPSTATIGTGTPSIVWFVASGIITLPRVADVPVGLVVHLSQAVERMPEATNRTIEGVPVPIVAVDGGTASAPIKVELALRQVGADPK